jgi:hypothetical protein
MRLPFPTTSEVPMTFIQRVALLFGLTFVVVALLGFVATGLTMSMSHAGEPAKLLGVFPVNVVHNLVHLAFGVWGLAAARSSRASMMFAMASGAVYFVLAGIGFTIPNPMGVVPIGGADVLLHLVIAAVLVSCALFEAVRGAAPATEREH